MLCDKEYSSLNSYNNHKRTYHSSKINKNTDNISNKNKNKTKTKIINNNVLAHKIDSSNIKLTDKLNITNNEISIVKDKIDESNRLVAKAITKASSLIKYLMENHPTTPPLKKITEEDFMDKLRLDFNCKYTEKNKYCLERELVNQYTKSTFVRNISQLILKLVNHNDHDKQSIYNTDCTRNNYVIKTSAIWNEDKAGIKFAEYVIRPLLNHIRKLIIVYRRNYIEKCDISKYTLVEHEIHANTYDNTLLFEDKLYDDSLIKEILKELSPYLRYLTKEIKDLEKFNKLEKLQEDLKEMIHNSDNTNDDNRVINYSDSDSNSDDNNNSDDNYNYIQSIKKESNYERMIRTIKEKYKYENTDKKKKE
jgi:hypothetical protein